MINNKPDGIWGTAGHQYCGNVTSEIGTECRLGYMERNGFVFALPLLRQYKSWHEGMLKRAEKRGNLATKPRGSSKASEITVFEPSNIEFGDYSYLRE